MHHLTTLKILHRVFAFFLGVIALVFLAMWCIGGIVLIRDGEPMGWVFLVGGLGIGSALIALATLHWKAGSAAPLGQRRILQSGLAVIHLMNFPIGTAFAVYTLWLCWFHEPTKIHFDLHDGRL